MFLATPDFDQWAWLNDKDPGIYDLWRMVKEEPETLISLMREHTEIIDHQKDPKKIEKAIQFWRDMKEEKIDVPSGYRALFLNKTCFSGVQTGGPTGGIHQTGKYNLMSRWALDSTIGKIEAAHARLKDVKITCLDYKDVIKAPGDFVMIFADPPYLVKGGMCYELAFTEKDHFKLAELLMNSGHRFVATIDDCPEVRKAWKKAGCPDDLMLSKEWLYSMTDRRSENRVGKELFVIDEYSYSLFHGGRAKPKKKVLEEFQ